jgi:hypothetical protein
MSDLCGMPLDESVRDRESAINDKLGKLAPWLANMLGSLYRQLCGEV